MRRSCRRSSTAFRKRENNSPPLLPLLLFFSYPHIAPSDSSFVSRDSPSAVHTLVHTHTLKKCFPTKSASYIFSDHIYFAFHSFSPLYANENCPNKELIELKTDYSFIGRSSSESKHDGPSPSHFLRHCFHLPYRSSSNSRRPQPIIRSSDGRAFRAFLLKPWLVVRLSRFAVRSRFSDW